MSPLLIVVIIIAILLLLLLAALLIKALTSKSADENAGGLAHDHSKGEENCPACQAAAKAVKVKVPLACNVHFRPKADWKGEFGFDWLRIGDAGEVKYKDIIAGGYKGVDAAGKAQVYNKTDAYVELKKAYQPMTTVIKSPPDNLAEYFVPYLNLYSKDVVLKPAPLTEVELRVLVGVEKSEPDKIEFEFDPNFFSLDKKTLADKAVAAKHEASDKTIKITCLKEFDTDQKIEAWAYPKGWKTKSDATLAGQLIVGKNNAAARKELKIVFIKVKTRINKTVNVGSLQAGEKDHIINSLHQALIHAVVDDGPEPVLDLTKDERFMIVTKAGKKQYGRYIYKKVNVADTNIDGGLYEDYEDAAKKKEMFIYARAAFIKKNKKYETYFTVLMFDEPTYDPVTYGQVEDFGVHNVGLFKATRPTGVLSHEGLHGLGLYHTHETSGQKDAKFFFDFKKTDNIMSYNFAAMNTTWAWQWQIIRDKL